MWGGLSGAWAQEDGPAGTADELAAAEESWLRRIDELDTANRELARQNQELRERLAEARAALEQSGVADERRLDDSRRQWFLAGAAVLGVGIVLGLLLPRLRRRRSRWSDL